MTSLWKAGVAFLALATSMTLAQDAATPAPASPVAGKADSEQATANPAATNAPDKPAMTAPESKGGSEYVIGPEDVLHIAVWKESDLSATLPVRP
ncbi:MAG: polysaccharide biosynthesis/export family protein, partial [Terriglobales bacterium]